jgi:tRNA threonylcarbamoyladenosine biosynthesis protein TsaE
LTTPTPQARTSVQAGCWTSRSPEDTFALGLRTGEQLRGGEILLLDGPLGAGKTIFAKGVAASLGIERDEVTSPSFTLVNIYEGRLKLFHLDLYRLNEGASAAHAVDLDELLMDERAIFIIEWSERMGRYPLPEPVWRVSITGDGDEPRLIVIDKQ